MAITDKPDYEDDLLEDTPGINFSRLDTTVFPITVALPTPSAAVAREASVSHR